MLNVNSCNYKSINNILNEKPQTFAYISQAIFKKYAPSLLPFYIAYDNMPHPCTGAKHYKKDIALPWLR